MARHGGAAVPRRAVPPRARASRARTVPLPCGPVGHLYLALSINEISWGTPLVFQT